MRTYIDDKAVYCAGSKRWLGAIQGLVNVSSNRGQQVVQCPECGQRVRVSRVNEVITHFAPYQVGPDGKRLGDAS